MVKALTQKHKDWFFTLIGVLGAMITFGGSLQDSTQFFFVLGSTLLLVTAFYYNLQYFIALEIILIAGHGSILLGMGSVLQIIMPVLLCLQLLFFYFLSGRLNNIFLLIGIIGIALLSLGFSYNNQWVFLIGSLAITTYAIHSYQSSKASLLWIVLNGFFALSALFKLLF